MNNRFSRKASTTGRGTHCGTRTGFTLIEMMVALSILMLMLAIIFVPLNLGINFFHMGRARAEVQQAAQLTLNQVEIDVRQAIFVFPNTAMPGITDRAPYTNGDVTGAGHPYRQSTSFDQTFTSSGTANNIVCDSSSGAFDNTSRIDFLLPSTATGSTVTPIQTGPYLITYYVRRLNPYDANTPPGFNLYESIDNPLVLYRAQMPINKMPATTPPTKNVDIDVSRYPTGACSGGQNDVSAWLAQSKYGEPDLFPLTQLSSSQLLPGQVGLHDLVTPRGMGLIAPHAADDQSAVLPTPVPTPSFIPETSFICDDTNGDGKIDRVKITISLGQFDTAGAQPTAQSVRLSDTIDLPNIQ